MARFPRPPAPAPLVLPLALMLAGCGDEAGAPTDPTPATPVRLAFVAQPGDHGIDEPITPAVVVELRDSDGDRVPNATNAVTVELAGGPAAARLSGTVTVRAADGVAAFDDLRVEGAGNGFTLTARSPGLEPATSDPFDVRFRLAALDAGGAHTCGLTDAGLAYCWGSNGSGQFGNGAMANGGTPAPTAGGHGMTFSELAGGGSFTCGRTTAGEDYCWGSNTWATLGDGTTRSTVDPVRVGGGRGFDRLTASGEHACGLTAAGEAYCWGWARYGRLGHGTDSGSVSCSGSADACEPEPVAVEGGLAFDALSAGGRHTCGITTDGAAYCWGDNTHGQLGTGSNTGPETCGTSTPCSTAPVAVAGDLTFSRIAVGIRHSCALTPAGEAYCWGQNAFGQVGDGSTEPRYSPTPVAGGLAFVELRGGRGLHTCGLTGDGAAYCWGWNPHGQLGTGSNTGPETCGTSTPCSTAPAAVDGDHEFAAVSASTWHTCALTSDGRAYCWGADAVGLLGIGSDDAPETCAYGDETLPCSTRPLRVANPQ